MDCLCGVCRSCRVEQRKMDRELRKPAPQVKPVVLSETALKILHESKSPPKKNRVPSVVQKTPPRVKRTKEEKLATEYESRGRLRDQRKAERIEVDGKMVHPRAPHATHQAVKSYCCRCPECTKFASAIQKIYVERRRAREAKEAKE